MTIRIEHRIGIAAPPRLVRELDCDLATWPEWTGLYTEARGRIAIGETLSFTYRLGQDDPVSTRGVVYDWVPEAQLAWESKLPRRVRSLRYVEIEKLTETSCILANGDYLSGIGTAFISPAFRAATRTAFQTMNENAKRIVEARWLEQGGEAAPVAAPAEPDLMIRPLMQPTPTSGKPWGFGGGRSGGLGPSLKR
jgi:hypothetical protein